MVRRSLSSSAYTVEQLIQFRLAHLSMLQGVVGRMSGYSATIKNFSVTVAAGLAALSFAHPEYHLVRIALLSVVLFAALDTYYLALERQFRATYDTCASRSLSDAHDLAIAPTGHRSRAIGRAVISFSVVGFYVPFVLVLSLIAGVSNGL